MLFREEVSMQFIKIMFFLILIGSAVLVITSGNDYENDKEAILDAMEECYTDQSNQCGLTMLFEEDGTDDQVLQTIKDRLKSGDRDVSEENIQKALDVIGFLENRTPEEREALVDAITE